MKDTEPTLSFLLADQSSRPKSSLDKSINEDPFFFRRAQSKSNSSSKLPKKSFNSSDNRKLKTSIQNRSKSVTEDKLSLEVTALVVKQYLLPMFEVENISPNLKAREKLMGFSGVTDALHKPFEVISGTVYGELKEAESLYRELMKAREELKAVTQKFKDAEQQKESYQAELDNLKKQKLGITAEIKLLQQDFLDSHRKYQLSDLKISYISGLCSEYRKLLNQSESEKNQYESDLREEKALNDKRRNMAAELEHGNELLKMENEIMSEKLRGLYVELDSLSSRRLLEDKLSIEIQELANLLKSYAGKVDNLSIQHLKTSNERKETLADNEEIILYTDEIRAIRDKFFNSAKETMTRLLKTLSSVTAQREEYRTQLSKLEKDYKDTVNEMAKIRKRIKQYKQTKGEGEEKVCKRCSKVYNENENYNWSCKRHAGEFSNSEQIWWCCGKQGPAAVGCQIAKHESKDDDDVLDKDKDISEKLKQMNTVCSSCKEIGHKPHDCPKDPNIRGSTDPYDEIARIENMRNKKRANADNIEISQKAMAFLSNRLGDQAFGLDMVSSFGSQENINESQEGLQIFKPFNDIEGIRDEVSFRSETNKIRIPMINTKELEKEKEAAKLKRSIIVKSSVSGRNSSNQGGTTRRYFEDQSDSIKDMTKQLEFLRMTPVKNVKGRMEFSSSSSASETEEHKKIAR